MTQLPTSIQQYLEESGFTPSEIAILKKLIEGKPVTVRELATKCGKSVGTLTQALQKLADKGIISKKHINENSKYDIESIDAIKHWIDKDTLKKYELLKRKKENFDAFMATVEQEKNQPDMEYFYGLEGMQKAYEKLLNFEASEWLKFCPADIDPKQNPLQEFDAELFRERKRRDISVRVLCPDTLNGKKLKDKDVFEHRQTKLLKSVEFPMSFTKFIVGDIVASFDFKEHKASFISFPEFADGQRNMFELYWDIATKDETGAQPMKRKQEPLEKKVGKQLKEFFFGRSSIVTLLCLAVTAGLVTGGLYFNNFRLQKERLADKAVAIASTAALEISGDVLENIHTKEDMQTQGYQQVFTQINDIRDRNEGVVYIYTIRPHEDPKKYEWIVDADSNYDLPFLDDLNDDGILNEADESVYPGQLWDVSDITELQTEDLTKPIRTHDFNSDQWGTFITGFAPVFNSRGELTALLGVDYWAEDVQKLTLQSFAPVTYFVVIFLIFLLVRLFAFNKTLSKELWELCKKKNVLVTAGVCAGVAMVLTFAVYHYLQGLNTERIREKVYAVATTGAKLFDANELSQLHTRADMQKPAYATVVEQLDDILKSNEGLKYVYIVRPTDQENMYEFVADSYGLDIGKGIDFNGDGILDEYDEIPVPGMPYDVSEIPGAVQGMIKPYVDREPFSDQWGTFISGFAPIFDEQGNAIAVLGVDKIANDVREMTLGTFSPTHYFFGIFVFLVLFRFVVFHRSLVQDVFRLVKSKQFLKILVLSVIIAFVTTSFLYRHNHHLNTQRIRERVKAIAATAAHEFSSKDIEQIHIWTDYKKPEYRKLITQLQGVRERNTGVVYVYIMRRTEDPYFFEFVVDADSLNLWSRDDLNEDGIINDMVAPGHIWLDKNPENSAFHKGYYGPSADEVPTVDIWGVWISGHAPIKDSTGNTVAILGVDMNASDVESLTKQNFSFLNYFSMIFTVLIGIFGCFSSIYYTTK